MLDIFIGTLKDNEASWNYVHLVGPRDKKFLVTEASSVYKGFGKIEVIELAKASLPDTELTLYGDINSLNKVSIEILQKAKAVSVVTFENDLNDQVATLPNLKMVYTPKVSYKEYNFKEPSKISYRAKTAVFTPTYNLNYMDPITSSPKKGIMIIGYSKEIITELETLFKGLVSTPSFDQSSIEIFFLKGEHDVKCAECSGTRINGKEVCSTCEDGNDYSYFTALKAFIRPKKVFFHSSTDKTFYADMFSSSYMVIDLTNQYNYRLSAFQYNAIYLTSLEEGLNPFYMIRNIISYTDKRAEILRTQSKELGLYYEERTV